jgi:hypothetical protein
MPPVRGGRASLACESCRKQKTRCYASENSSGICLRCDTLSQTCSLTGTITNPRRLTAEQAVPSDRLDHLERTVETLLRRLEDNGVLSSSRSVAVGRSDTTSTNCDTSRNATPPMQIIRSLATDGIVDDASIHHSSTRQLDVIDSGLITPDLALSLLTIFRRHYGRWVRFDDTWDVDTLLVNIRRSCLLLCSVFLIAVRHTSQEIATALARPLFEEAKRLLEKSLLITPHPISFFQAALILSLWSTTIGQTPLSLDSWLITGYAIQNARGSPKFDVVLRNHRNSLPPGEYQDAWLIWNHLCVSHLQYCVGTRRPPMITHAQIEQVVSRLELDAQNNFETRMIAELQLYWVMYQGCRDGPADLAATVEELHKWRQRWDFLYGEYHRKGAKPILTELAEPRAQFLDMGYHFGLLLAHRHSLKTSQAVMRATILREMVRLSSAILNIAIESTDDRTKHLTDHIYHVVTFSAVTLVSLVASYEPKLRADKQDVVALNGLVNRIVEWLGSIGLPGHTAQMLSKLVSAHHHKLQPDYYDAVLAAQSQSPLDVFNQPYLADDISLQYPDFLGSELLDIDLSLWPQWDATLSESDVQF